MLISLIAALVVGAPSFAQAQYTASATVSLDAQNTFYQVPSPLLISVGSGFAVGSGGEIYRIKYNGSTPSAGRRTSPTRYVRVDVSGTLEIKTGTSSTSATIALRSANPGDQLAEVARSSVALLPYRSPQSFKISSILALRKGATIDLALSRGANSYMYVRVKDVRMVFEEIER